MKTILIGLDDTDNQTSRGTGHLARQLAAQCARRGMKFLSVTRHQFLLDDRIRYTSHNSGACITLQSDSGSAAAEFAFDFVRDRCAPGSDPGVCIAVLDNGSQAIMEFGQRATRQIIEMDEAYQLAQTHPIQLQGLGGTNEGVIGALGSVGLRAWGNEGRFIDLPGLRHLPERVNADTLTALGIEPEHTTSARRPGPDDIYDTLGWVRPRLIAGKCVWPVQWSEKYHAWIPVDRKKTRPLE